MKDRYLPWNEYFFQIQDDDINSLAGDSDRIHRIGKVVNWFIGLEEGLLSGETSKKVCDNV